MKFDKEKKVDTISFIGGGNMTEALIKGIINAGVYKPRNIFVSDIRPERLAYLAKEYGVKTTDKNDLAAAEADVLVLAVKPQQIIEVLYGIKNAPKENALIISIAAGIKIANISTVLGDMAIVRVMPNTPALIGEGVSALFANDKAKSMMEKAKSIFLAVGRIVVVVNENLMDAVTAISGGGPAYYFFLMETMMKVAVEFGLSGDIAKNLVLQTAKGAALLAVEADKRGEDLAELRKKVTSRGGTTEAALNVWADINLAALIAAGIKQARRRSKELSK